MQAHEQSHILLNGEDIPMEQVITQQEMDSLVSKYKFDMKDQIWGQSEIDCLLNWAVTTRAHMMALDSILKGDLVVTINVGQIHFFRSKGGPGLLI